MTVLSILILAGFMKTVPSDSWSPHNLNWLNYRKYRQETQLLPMVLLRWLSSWFLISKRNNKSIKKTLWTWPYTLAAWTGMLETWEFKVKSPPWLPPPPSLARAWGECFHWPMGLKHYKNLTWQTKGRHDQCTDSPRARLTEGTTLLQHPPPLGIDMEAPSQPMTS